MVWSNAKVQEVVRNFIPVADKVERLREGDDPECRFFKKIAREGYAKSAGQGTYAATPSGTLLGSGNFYWKNPGDAVAMLEGALEKWSRLAPLERQGPDPGPESPRDDGGERLYPSDGLALRVHSLDLPRDRELPRMLAEVGYRNADNAWFRRQEAALFVPQRLERGATHEVPRELVERLVRFHLLDGVTGLPYPFPREAVEKARLAVSVLEVKGTLASLRLEGETRASEGRTFQEPHGYEAKLLGRGTYDSSAGKLTAFELVAVGKRWGAMNHSERLLCDDHGPAPLGFVLKLAEGAAAERIPPLFVKQYGWK